jgi:hypothetical protein
MRTWRGSARPAFVLFAALSASSISHAQLLVAATPGDPPAIEHAELAYALGAGPAVTWLSLRIQRGPVAVVAALPESAAVGDALDAWFSALDGSAAPSVVAPAGAPACGRGGNLVRAIWPRARALPAAELSLDSALDVTAALSAEGLTLESELPEASRFVVWSWSAVDAVQTTRTLRVEGGAAPLSLLPGFSFPVALTAITSGPMTYERERDKQLLEVTFRGGEPPSTDYLQRLRDFVAGSAPLLETRARSLLFDWSLYGDVVSVAPLVQTFASHAERELSQLDVDGCTEQLRALRDSGAHASACGDARDASLALSAANPELATLQRLALSSRDGVTPAQLQGGGEPSPPLLRARLFDDSACDTAPLPPIVADPRPSPGAGSLPPSTTGQDAVVEKTVIVEHEHVEVDCGGSPEPEPAYDYYEDDDVDCSSDTSRSSDTTDDEITCAGDSSTSSESGDEVDCASDSSSSSSTTDDGCSGDTTSESGGYDGDTCTGSAAPRTGPPARNARTRPRRLKASLWTLAFAAVVLPIRRRKRGPSAGG